MSRIGFIGVGKLGQACAEMMAEKHDVIGYDIRPRTPENFTMSGTLEGAVVGREIIFIAVETPHEQEYDGSVPTSHLPNKDFNYAIVREILQKINAVATREQLIVLISTVLPGTVRREFATLISNARFVYNPYLIAMGTVKWDMVNPEMIMIGTEDGSETGDAKRLVDFYKTIMENSPRYIVGTWDECECIKVFYNTFISAKVSLVNMIQDVAEKLGNIDAELVCDALAKSERRIMGPAYMKPGMGDGGACHPRDNIALRWLAEKLELGYDLFDAVMTSREIQAENMAKHLMSYGLPVVIVGKAYKPLVEYTNGSSSMLVGHFIHKAGHEMYYLDEIVGEYPPDSLGSAVYLLAHSPEVTYGQQLDQVKNFHQRHALEGGTKTLEHSAAIVSSGNKAVLQFPAGSIVVDPWRKTPPLPGVRVVHYGNTRSASLR